MKKLITLMLVSLLALSLLAGCAGTPVVYYTECNCPTDTAGTTGTTDTTDTSDTAGTSDAAVADPQPAPAAGSLKTGLSIVTSVAGSENAVQADYDVTLVAVLVDDNGVIQDCIIDSIGTQVPFDATGAITADLNAEILTKTELGDEYGMKAYAGSQYEWYEQAGALADYAVGKTVEELKTGAIDESGKAPEGSDLATTATIYLGGYVSAIEEAAANAQHLGAQAGDELKLASTASIDGSTGADAENAGNAQLDVTVTALTEKDGVITSCVIDAVQAKVAFDTTGTITTDLTAPVQTKNQLGEGYGMKAWGGAIAEWNEQAAAFAAYVTGKTADEVAGIAVDETTAPTDADLTASVTIKIGGFQSLIAKAMG